MTNSCAKKDLNHVTKKDSEDNWQGVIVDYLYVMGDKLENVFAHAKLIHGHREDGYEYYEIMVPSHDFFTCYIDGDKIEKFL